MSVATFGSAAVLVDCTWTELKAICATKTAPLQYTELAGTYVLFTVDDSIVYRCGLMTAATLGEGRFSEDYTREQNDADVADFEASYKAVANQSLRARTKDGRTVVRDSTANRTTNFKLRAITFYTCELVEGLHNVSPITGVDYGDVAMHLYDAGGVEITTEERELEAVKTVLDFEPRYNYEIIGGFLDIPDDLRGGTTDAWFISAVGVPDYPPEYFGSVDFISEVNIEAVTAARVQSDGRAVSYMPYQLGGMPHTNRLRFTIRHPVGARKRFQLFIEHFVLCGGF